MTEWPVTPKGPGLGSCSTTLAGRAGSGGNETGREMASLPTVLKKSDAVCSQFLPDLSPIMKEREIEEG